MSVGISYERTYTVEELDELPDDGNIYELIEGKLKVSPPPGDEHGRIGRRITKAIHLFDPEGKLGEDWQATRFWISSGFGPAPDVAFVVAERVPPVSKGPVPVVPDLVVEVHSPSDLRSQQERDDAQMKIRLYQVAGVKIIWAVNPADKIVEVYHPGQIEPVQVLGMDSELDGENIIPGFKLKVRALFE